MTNIIPFPVTEKMKQEKTYKYRDLPYLPKNIYWKCSLLTAVDGNAYAFIPILTTEEGRTTSYYLYDEATDTFYIERSFRTTAPDDFVMEEFAQMSNEATAALLNSFSRFGDTSIKDVFECAHS